MLNSELIQPHHRNRKAVIYIRQSSGHQVLTNVESRRMQHAMREHARGLGWDDSRIEIVEADTGTTATSTTGRDAYKDLLAQMALGQIGIVLSYDSARLARNCSDWYPLLDLCTYKNCLIADRDGVYDPSKPNDRLLLGMKGIVSEVELHTLRGRLIAGVQNKAQRGELALALPVGFLRLEDGRVVKDPNLQIQHTIDLIFRTFLERRSANKVLQHLRQQGLRIPRRHRNTETVWRTPTAAAVVSILRNPAYAGAFVYGRTKTVRSLETGRPRSQHRRHDMSEWGVVVQDRYPSYISWETFQHIQSTLTDNFAEYSRNRSRGVPREGAALLQGLIYCGECGHKMFVQYKYGSRYMCSYLQQQMQAPVCQYMPADPIDEHVVNAFFQALSPVELDLYENAMRSRHDQRRDDQKAQERELQRLRYDVQLARRQYDRVDPDHRLVATELERRWEAALKALREAEERFEHMREDHDKVIPMTVPRELRTAFSSLGQSLPELWRKGPLNHTQRKAMLRCLIEKVVLRRTGGDCIYARIVWRGGAVSEATVAVPTRSVRALSGFERMEAQLLELEAQGKSDEEIAALLTQQGFHSPMRATVLPSTVRTIRLRHQRIHRFRGPRHRHVAGFLTLPQVAQALGVTPHWLYHAIRRRRIAIERDPGTGLYLFPDRPSTLKELRQLQSGATTHVSP